ncbi:ankyrin repeat domain-containing protein [Spirosoma foliorum]|uniref:Ankyrin repeat domain-containing protein n=1 Tax=Spirosoma foliorum TaxID=2710596 RepID=A0A7G5GQD7_9BACT|nr:ankyrin repeat domain-containing protein [Spirosoma foliorum]QMW01079.1 ankyrin repeat domain-containing protein [Spirosoma foliorum]
MSSQVLPMLNGIMAVKPIVFSPRILKVIWLNFDFYGLFMNNPDAPSEETFQAYYEAHNQNSVFSWVDQPNGLTYQYDLSINQAQVTPAIEPHAERVTKLNKRLWELLPPELLDTNDNWKKAWLTAARKLDIATMRFIIEQGFNVDVVDEDGYTALYHAVTPYGGSYNVVELLVEAGADLTLPINNVDFLIKVGWEGVAGNGEASEAQSIAAYLRNCTHGL